MKKKKYFGKDLEALFYAENYYRWILGEFTKYIGKDLVDIGAGSGVFSKLLLETNPTSLVAIEPSSNMYPLLLKRFKNKKKS